MAHPLPSSYNWHTPVFVSSVGLVLCVFLLARTRANGWVSVVAVLVAIWAVFVLVAWSRTRAMMIIDGPVLTVRRFRAVHELDGRRLASVRESTTGSGPSYRVELVDDPTSYYIPTALISHGHSAFFGWVLRYAPEASLDRRSIRTVEQLRTRGLLS